MEWIFDNLFIVAIAGYFLLSFLGKLGKGGEQKPSQMPTFGNEKERRNQQPRPAGSQPAGPPAAESDSRQLSRRSTDSSDREQGRYESPYHEQEEVQDAYEDAKSRLESAAENLDTRKVSEGMEERKRQMQRDLEGAFADLDRLDSGYKSPLQESASEQSQPQLSQSDLADRAVQGIIWSEILGPPRAKKPLGRRR
ncbi:hypothetical protein [Paenibacillus lemnae]|uniref:Uncharacterized protein n=1 Tax=Paenibacillus lemnae TaxID=1330551 RepID=A0A848M3L9_PAELE|nr:hypothetical protein [Paenibacillus lemnae]NMO94831.1 hypothetical protein [Paenibacillus lemnae]